jgi:hypothetical protein
MSKSFLANPQFHLTVTNKMELLLLLEQPDLRMKYQGEKTPEGKLPPMFPTPIGLTVLRVPPDKVGGRLSELPDLLEAMVHRSPQWPKQRDTSIVFELLPAEDGGAATYAIVPSTFKPKTGGRFRLHLWANQDSQLLQLKPYTEGEANVSNVGGEDVGWDLEAPERFQTSPQTLPSVDDSEAEDETRQETKASSAALVDTAKEIGKLRSTVDEQRQMLDEQKVLIDQLTQWMAQVGGAPPAIAMVAPEPRAAGGEGPSHVLTRSYVDHCDEFAVDPNAKVMAALAAVEMAADGIPLAPKLDLSLCLVGDRGMLPLARTLGSCHRLVDLTLRGNAIRDEGATTLAAAMRRGTKLCRLDLGDNQLGPSGAAAVLALVQAMPTLTDVDLGGNTAVDAATAASIVEMAGVNAARARMMEDAAKIFLHTRDPSVLLNAFAQLGT